MVMIGVIASMFPIMTAQKHKNPVVKMQTFGFLKQPNLGKTLSFAMDSSNFGAPAVDWRPAPAEERIIPTITMYLVGQATSAANKISLFYKVVLSATPANNTGNDR